jgi:hypothetical protein
MGGRLRELLFGQRNEVNRPRSTKTQRAMLIIGPVSLPIFTVFAKLFDGPDRQIMNPSLVVLITGNRHLIFHSAGDAVRNGLVILRRQQDVHGAGSLLDEGYGDSFLGTYLRAFLMARAVNAHGHVAE